MVGDAALGLHSACGELGVDHGAAVDGDQVLEAVDVAFVGLGAEWGEGKTD